MTWKNSTSEERDHLDWEMQGRMEEFGTTMLRNLCTFV